MGAVPGRSTRSLGGFKVRWGALVSALLCEACAVGPSAPRTVPKSVADIPIEIRHRLPTVKVLISGEPFELFLDLAGHRAMALTPSELSRAKVRYLPHSDKFQNSYGQTLQARRFVAERVFLGDLALGDVEGGESIFGDSAPPDRNGYIGMPILGRYLLVVDYPAKRIRFYRSGDAAALQSECGASTFPITVTNGTARSVGSTEFGDRLFLWDTGAMYNNIHPSALPRDIVRRRIDDGPPVIGTRLKLGDVDIGAQEFRIQPFGAPAVDAYLGGDLFLSRKVCLDIPQGRGAMRESS